MLSPNGMASVRRALFSIAMLCVGSLLGAGCSSSDDPKTAAVSGKVTRGGQPVSGGSVIFSPRASADKKGPPGKPAAAEVGADGAFTLTTYAKYDGAVIGKHLVTYTPAPIEVDEKQHKEDSKPPVSPFAGLIPSKTEVEVKAGPNTVDIELVPDPKAGS